MKKVIITGANGFVGSELVKKYHAEGAHVIAVDRFRHPSKLPTEKNIQEIKIDLEDAYTLPTLIEEGEYDAFYHLAWRGVNGPEKADPFIQLNNIKTAIECAEAAKKIGCKKFLCAGTIAERAVESLENLAKTSGGMMYGTAKYCCHQFIETYCKNIGLDFVWMQFSNIYGPLNKTGNLISYTINQLANSQEASFGPANQLYDFIFVDDLIEAVYRLGINQTKQNRYFIGSGKPRVLKEYLMSVGSACGKPELIKIGQRMDDGIKYDASMFDTAPLVRDIGEYVTVPFEAGIELTIKEQMQ